jgi:superfamily II DNA/RNA helicase
MSELKKVMKQYGNGKTIIFVKMKKTADIVHNHLKSFGINVLAIHGDKDQRERELTLQRFRREPNCSLVATDVAARGLDVKVLDVVINYDFAANCEDYVHRIGRTGRAGKPGVAHSFFDAESAKLAPEVMELLRKANQPIPDKLEEYARFAGRPNRSRERSFMSFGKGIAPYRHDNKPSQGADHDSTKQSFKFVDSDSEDEGAAAPKAVFGVPSKNVHSRDDDDEAVEPVRSKVRHH